MKGLKKGELNVVMSPTGRIKSRLVVNLPGEKETVGVCMPEIDFSALEERVSASVISSTTVIAQSWPVPSLLSHDNDTWDADEMEAVASLMREADRCIDFQRSKAKTGDTFTVCHMNGKSRTFTI